MSQDSESQECVSRALRVIRPDSDGRRPRRAALVRDGCPAARGRPRTGSGLSLAAAVAPESAGLGSGPARLASMTVTRTTLNYLNSGLNSEPLRR